MARHSKEDFRKNFIKTSFDYLIKNGLENTSVRDLCKANGISSGNLYYWFEGKDEIYISTAEYGLNKVVTYLFAEAFGALKEDDGIKKFFDNATEYFDNVKSELRFVYQVATSPVYGEVVRKRADALQGDYQKYIEKLAELFNCSAQELAPIIFLFISALLDYVIWEDMAVTKMQLKYLHNLLESHTKR